MVDWRQDQVVERLEGFEFGEGEIDVVGGAEHGEVFVVGAVHAVLLYPVGGHDGPVTLLVLALKLLLLEGEVVLEFALFSGRWNVGLVCLFALRLEGLEEGVQLLGSAIEERLHTRHILSPLIPLLNNPPCISLLFLFCLHHFCLPDRMLSHLIPHPTILLLLFLLPRFRGGLFLETFQHPIINPHPSNHHLPIRAVC